MSQTNTPPVPTFHERLATAMANLEVHFGLTGANAPEAILTRLEDNISKVVNGLPQNVELLKGEAAALASQLHAMLHPMNPPPAYDDTGLINRVSALEAEVADLKLELATRPANQPAPVPLPDHGDTEKTEG